MFSKIKNSQTLELYCCFGRSHKGHVKLVSKRFRITDQQIIKQFQDVLLCVLSLVIDYRAPVICELMSCNDEYMYFVFCFCIFLCFVSMKLGLVKLFVCLSLTFHLFVLSLSWFGHVWSSSRDYQYAQWMSLNFLGGWCLLKSALKFYTL